MLLLADLEFAAGGVETPVHAIGGGDEADDLELGEVVGDGLVVLGEADAVIVDAGAGVAQEGLADREGHILGIERIEGRAGIGLGPVIGEVEGDGAAGLEGHLNAEIDKAVIVLRAGDRCIRCVAG